MSQPTRSELHVNRPLTNLSIAYNQEDGDFVADKVFPVVPVPNQSDNYYEYSRKQWFRTDAQERAPGTESAGTGYNTELQTYNAKVFGLHHDIPDQDRANADSVFQLDREATELVTVQQRLRKEKIFVNNFMTTGKWTTDFTPGTLWSAGGSDPIADVRAQARTIFKKTGRRPNKFVVSPDVDDILKDHPTIIDRMKITETQVVTNSLLASLFEVGAYMVASAIEDSNEEGLALSMDHILTKDALLVYANPSPGLRMPSGGYTFVWSRFPGGTAGQRIKKFRMEELASDRVESEHSYDQKLVSADLGTFFDNVIA